MIRKSMIWLLVLVMMFSSLAFAAFDDTTEEIPDLVTLEESVDVNGISPTMINRGDLRFNVQIHEEHDMFLTLVQVVEEDEEIKAIEASIVKALNDGKNYSEVKQLISDSRKLADNSVESSQNEDRDVQPLNLLLNPTEYRMEVALTVVNYIKSTNDVKESYEELVKLKENAKIEPLSIIPATLTSSKDEEQKIALAEIKYNALKRKNQIDEEAYQKLFERVIIDKMEVKSEGFLPYLYINQPGVGIGNYKIYFEDNYKRKFNVVEFEILSKEAFDELQANSLQEGDNE